jgi:hypothetical protein
MMDVGVRDRRVDPEAPTPQHLLGLETARHGRIHRRNAFRSQTVPPLRETRGVGHGVGHPQKKQTGASESDPPLPRRVPGRIADSSAANRRGEGLGRPGGRIRPGWDPAPPQRGLASWGRRASGRPEPIPRVSASLRSARQRSSSPVGHRPPFAWSVPSRKRRVPRALFC